MLMGEDTFRRRELPEDDDELETALGGERFPGGLIAGSVRAFFLEVRSRPSPLPGISPKA